MSNIEVMDPKDRPSSGKDLRPDSAEDVNGNELKLLGTDVPAQYFLPANALVNLVDGAAIEAGSILARIPQQSSVTETLQGLPRSRLVRSA